jgi:hypothetical protein
MVLYNPRAGGHMNRLSLLNLAGRAGRLKQDYYGKIFCLNLKEWQTKNPDPETIFSDKPERVESSAEKTLDTKISLLIKYLENVSQECPGYIKSLATSLLMKMIKQPNGSVVASFLKRCNVDNEDIQIILKRLETIRTGLSLRKDIILKHKSFDPRIQDELYKALNSMEDFPTLPFPDDKKAAKYFYGNVGNVFSYIAYYLLLDGTRKWQYYGVLASKWIEEISYRKLLDNKIDFCWRNFGEEDKEFHNRMIEELDYEIERVLRYDYTRALKCYSDIIQLILEERDELWKRSCQELPIYLEWGSYNKNALLLLEIGLSRNAAIAIGQLIKQEKSTSSECIAWIGEHLEDTIKKELHPFLVKEVERFLEQKRNQNP